MGCAQSKSNIPRTGMIDDNTNLKCIICLEYAEEILWPCGHFCLCSKCVCKLSKHRYGKTKLILNGKEYRGVKCPICRTSSLPLRV